MLSTVVRLTPPRQLEGIWLGDSGRMKQRRVQVFRDGEVLEDITARDGTSWVGERLEIVWGGYATLPLIRMDDKIN
jgi:hypothetical protein